MADRPATKLDRFPDRLREAREATGWRQSDLARQSGFRAAAISNFETGRRRPCLRNLVRLADALGVTTDYLAGR